MGGFLQRVEEVTLAFDALGEGADSVGERMAPPGLREALHQGVGLRFQEQNLGIADAAPQCLHRTWQFIEALAAADVDTDCHAGVSRLIEKIDERCEQLGREIVDDVEAAVLEHVEGDALTGTGQTTDQDQTHGWAQDS